jgi:hypothetical protein
LEDALLSARGERYAFYRLRYVFLRAILRTGMRLFEVALFASSLPFEMLGVVLVLRSGLMLTEGLWWGALEPLRSDIRQLFATGRTGQASLRIRQWLLLAGALGVLGLAASGLWVWLGPSPYRSFSVIDVYILGCAVRWCVDLWSTTYHAGIYGVRRVHRPLWSLVLTDVADVAILGAAFLWIGVWGLGISIALVGLIRGVVAWWFTRRVYRQLKFDLGGLRAWLSGWTKSVWTPRRSVEFALGNVVGEVDALLVVGLIAAPGNPRGTLLLAALFHVLAPLHASASSWPRLFYFDFKRLQAWGSPLLLGRFEAFLERTAWWVPVPIGLVTLGILAAFWRGQYGWLAFELLCLAAVRSRLSLAHVRAYSLADLPFLRRLFFGMVAVAAVGPLVAHLAPQVALGLVVALSAVGLLLVGRSQRPLESRRPVGLVGVSVWLHYLLREVGPLYVGLARIDRRLTTLGRVEYAWRATLNGGVAARLSHDTLVWFAREPAERKQLFADASGALRELHVGASVADGKQALLLGLPSAAWQRHLGNATLTSSDTSPSVSLATLERALMAVHPKLALLPLTLASTIPGLTPALRRDLTRIVLEATHGRTGLRRLGTLDVAVLAPGGTPIALLTAPAAERPTTRTWRADLGVLLERAEIVMTLAQGSLALPPATREPRP